MCGRFTQTKSRKETLEALTTIELPPLFHRRYNVAPTQKVAIVQQQEPTQAVESIWGLEHSHSGAPIINARSEALAERPMFKHLIEGHRCLIFADGFYEWSGKQPYYFQLEEQPIFAFAGLYSRDRCTIITRAANANMRGIHDRMPVILNRSRWEEWLKTADPLDLLRGTAPPLTCRPVSRRVNSVAHDDPRCLDPAEIQTEFL
ncbi:MAG: SOS response-associated peptidase [Lentisphaerae bacterium]|jgi:putative SOS response-associated peptidase YedK|nr:SOS response-associated peptidase [Lentisphaerota bacterium]